MSFPNLINFNFQSCTPAFQSIFNENFRAMINNELEFGGKYIYIDQPESSKYRAMCEKNITKLIHHSVFIVVGIVTTFTLLGLDTMYEIVIQQNRVTFLSTELPFFETDSMIGYLVRLSMEAVLSVTAMVGLATHGIGDAIAYNAYSAIPDIISIDAEELEMELNSNGMTLFAKYQLRNIILKVQDLYRYNYKRTFLHF